MNASSTLCLSYFAALILLVFLYEGVIYSLILCSACEAAICFTLLMNASFTLLFSKHSHILCRGLFISQCALNLTLAFHGFQKKLKIQMFYIVSSECLKHNLYDHRKRVEAI